ncbi:MAG: spore photoproduct lyase family protein [Solirubrobacteraceae bacterium]
MVITAPKLWIPERALITAPSLEHAHGRRIAERCAGLGVDVVELPGNRLTGLRDADERDAYRRAKKTLAIVVSPPSSRRLQPVPPSADWRLDIARGCPAHCEYCYLAGSLPGAPVTRVYADLEEILDNARGYEGSFEASCYTDPLALEHLTGSVARAIEGFGTRTDASLRFTTKFDDVDSLLDLDHRRRTRVRFSVNAPAVERFEGGTARVAARLAALRRVALAGYRVGLTIAPIMPMGAWRAGYQALLDEAGRALDGIEDADLTVELITHRFTDSSKRVLTGWYPQTGVDMDEDARTLKRTKFRGTKHVYPRAMMTELRTFFETEVPARLPGARMLYFT